MPLIVNTDLYNISICVFGKSHPSGRTYIKLHVLKECAIELISTSDLVSGDQNIPVLVLL